MSHLFKARNPKNIKGEENSKFHEKKKSVKNLKVHQKGLATKKIAKSSLNKNININLMAL